jgi:glycosyltransferase involved in cell wall biosynthesis
MGLLIDRPDRRQEMGSNAERMIRDRFTWQQTVDRLVDIYEELVN